MGLRAMGYEKTRAGLVVGCAVAGGALLAACTSTPVPAPFSASPAPLIEPSVVASIQVSSPPPVAARTTAPVATVTAATVTPTSAPASKPATAGAGPSAAPGAIRRSYPGIKKLVIVHSRWNTTPGGRAAINTVAAYNSALATATNDRSIDSARQLASADCVQCQSDIKRIGGYVAAGQRVVAVGAKTNTWLASTIFVSAINSRGVATVRFTGSEPPVCLLSAHGDVLASNAASYVADTETVDTRTLHPTILQIDVR